MTIVVICPACGEPIVGGEATIRGEGPAHVLFHEHCVDAEDAEAAIAAGDYDPGEDYPHGAY